MNGKESKQRNHLRTSFASMTVAALVIELITFGSVPSYGVAATTKSASAPQGSQPFSCQGDEAQWFTVPEGVSQVFVTAIGAQGTKGGGGSGGAPGFGASVQAVVPVVAGASLQVIPGCSQAASSTTAGWGIGGDHGIAHSDSSATDGGYGGGSSGVGMNASTPLVVAGGGGGGSGRGADSGSRGVSGGNAGDPPQPGASGGVAGGCAACSDGENGEGGDSSSWLLAGGAGGGGGGGVDHSNQGGGGGHAAGSSGRSGGGGGAGASYTSPEATITDITTSNNTGSGNVTISWGAVQIENVFLQGECLANWTGNIGLCGGGGGPASFILTGQLTNQGQGQIVSTWLGTAQCLTASGQNVTWTACTLGNSSQQWAWVAGPGPIVSNDGQYLSASRSQVGGYTVDLSGNNSEWNITSSTASSSSTTSP